MPRFQTHPLVRRTSVVGGFGVCLAIGAVAASATPPAGVVGGPILSRGTATEDMVVGIPRRGR